MPPLFVFWIRHTLVPQLKLPARRVFRQSELNFPRNYALNVYIQRPISWSCQRFTGTKTRNDEDPNCCGLCCRTKLPSHPETNAEENESTQVPEAVCRGPKQLTVKSKPIPLFCLVLIQRKDSCVLGRGKKKKRDSRGQCLDKKFEEKADVA